MAETPYVRDEFVGDNPRETLGCSACILMVSNADRARISLHDFNALEGRRILGFLSIVG